MNTPAVGQPGMAGPLGGVPAAGDCELIGSSVEGRPLIVSYCGEPGARLRIFILAGQHGDEPDARNAAAELLNRVLGGALRAPAHMAVVTDANPDGALAGTRRNAADVDLNRDHLLLSTPEISAIHAFVDRWQPDLIIDVHTYRPWRRELLPFDFVFPQDVMIDFQTNPAIRSTLGPSLQRKALEFMKLRMIEAGIRFDRYTIIRSGIVRHSNVDILDARNALAVRFEIPAVLIEGRRASPDDSVSFTPPHIALLRSIEAVIGWAAENSEAIAQQNHDFPGPVPVRCHHSGSSAPRYMEMQSASRGDISVVEIPGSYLPDVTVTRTVQTPSAYGVPRSLTGVLTAVAKHRFETAVAGQFRSSITKAYQIESLIPSSDEDTPALPICSAQAVPLNLDDFVVFPTRQPGGRLLSLLLEPESQFGPHRLPELAELLQPGALYPVIRVV
jgi:Zinc carboxypeptidase